MKKIEILVTILTFLIFIALFLLVYGLSKGWHKQKKMQIDNINNYEQIFLDEPLGSEINSINSFNNLIVITISGPKKNSQRLILINPMNGKIHSKFFLNKNFNQSEYD